MIYEQVNMRNLRLCIVAVLYFWLGAVVAASGSNVREISFDQFYIGSSVQPPEFSPLAKSLAGKRVRISAYVAAPFRAEAEFLMLTRVSMHICPYCNSDNNWPVDIIVAYTRGIIPAPNSAKPVIVTGVLEIGEKLDAVTGMVGQLRLIDATVEPMVRR